MIKKTFLALVICFGLSSRSMAADFVSSYPCYDSGRICTSSGTREIGGFKVTKDCWEWSYTKTCSYPSKNDCSRYSHCYIVGDKGCLLRDSLGNCVNLQREFSCESWEPVTYDLETVRTGLVTKEGAEQLLCKGVPCIDGTCVDKSYLTDADMMDSVSKLYAVSQAKGAKDMNFRLFEGFSQSCSKKATSYTNCCSRNLSGWGTNLGAKCTRDERDLVDKRLKNLCVDVGDQSTQVMGVTTVVKSYYCCFGSLLNKVIQVQGRKQLGMNFGSGGSPDCRGLTLAEIMRLDFQKMDFSEFYTEIIKKMKLPNIGDISARVNSSLPKVNTYDNNPNNTKNNLSGWNEKAIDEK